MKTLLILRHAKSSWKDSSLPDHDRPLNKRGKQDAPKMGRLLDDEGLVPDLIISSTAKRARSTVYLVAEACGYENEIVFTRDLYHAAPDDYLDVLNLFADDEAIVMVVGHNPGVEELLDMLTGESAYLTTANVAQIDLPVDSWQDLDDFIEGKLINLWRPKEF